MAARHRLDVWLKLVCVFKQRSDAAEACRSGHVRLNGNRAKPSSEPKENDVVEITGERYRKLVVIGLPEHSISKEVARSMYRDESPPPPPRDPFAPTLERERGAGRPTKKDRRDLERAKRG